MTNALPIARLVNVQVNLSPAAAQMQNISTLLVLGSSNVIDIVERFRTYTGIDGVAADFGTSAAEYLAALLWFEQAPQPVSLQIGRWAKTASSAGLRCATLSAAQQTLATWTAITTGAFNITVNAVTADVTGLTFAAQTSMAGIAGVIQTAMQTSFTGSTCVWNAVFNRFEINSALTGVTSVVSFVGTPATGVNISGMLLGRSTDSGAYVIPGQALETAVAAVTLFDQNFGQNWYAVTVLGGVDADYLAVGAYIEAATNKHIHGVSTQAAGTISSVSTTDLAYLLKQLAYKRTVVQYSSSNAYSACSLLGRILTTNYNANNTVITLMYKQEPGIVPETLNVTQVSALEAKNANVFVAYNNNTAIIENGVACSGDFLDIITGTDWIALSIQNAVYNLLYTSTTKIPQTDAGNQALVSVIAGVCSQGVTNGLLAPGVWQAGGFGALNMGDFIPAGFYIYAPPIATQNSSDRAARKSVPIQVAAKLAGAIHTVGVIINVNR
jgi:hypothetical protein